MIHIIQNTIICLIFILLGVIAILYCILVYREEKKIEEMKKR